MTENIARNAVERAMFVQTLTNIAARIEQQKSWVWHDFLSCYRTKNRGLPIY